MEPTPTESTCPPTRELRRLIQRDMPEAESLRLLEHLRDCAVCRLIWEGLKNDTIAFPSPSDDTPNGDTDCGDAGPPNTAFPPAWSSGFALEGGGGDRPAGAAAPALYSFLKPSRGGGEMGWLAHYRVNGVLGEGGMGFVFDAFDTQLNRRVALKVLKPDLASNLSFRERFLQEARTAAALPDEYIITIYQVGIEEGQPFLAMKFLHGESLEERLQREGRLPMGDVMRIGREVALGLSAAHERGLIHRDIKPANLWLETPPADDSRTRGTPLSCEYIYRLKILDFGLARLINDPRRLTATGLIVGTPSYLSPEQARGRPLDHRCDLFSLGCVLYRMVAGVVPFDGPDTLAQLTALAVADPQPIEELAADVPAGLRDLIHQLLARDADDRPPSARAVAETLRVLEKSETPTREVLSVAKAPARSARPLPRDRRSSSRRRWLAGLAGTAFLGLVSGGVWWLRPFSTTSPPLGDEPIRVGVLFSQSGPMAASGGPAVDVAQLAIDELNQQGGLLGRRIEAVIEDGASTPSRFREMAEKMIVQDRVHAIFGSRTSANRKAVRDVVDKHSNLLFYTMQFEGLEQSPNIVYLGAAPNQQMLPALSHLLGIEGKQRLFLVGSDYVFPRAANAILRDFVKKKYPRVEIVGEKYISFGNGEVREVVDAIRDGKADLIVNTINGDTNAAFFRTLHQSGNRAESTPVLSLSVGENDLISLGDAGVGHYAVWSYFQSIDRPENRDFVGKFQQHFGKRRVVSDPMEMIYVAFQLWARAVQTAGSTDPKAVRQAIKGLSYEAPEGKVRIDPQTGYTWRVMRLGRVTAGGQFEILWTAEAPRQPQPYPDTRSRAEWEKFLNGLYAEWGGHWLAPSH